MKHRQLSIEHYKKCKECGRLKMIGIQCKNAITQKCDIDKTFIYKESTLNNFVNKHSGQTAWILGKGQSLELLPKMTFEKSEIIVCINESFLALSKFDDNIKVDYVFGHPIEAVIANKDKYLYVVEDRYLNKIEDKSNLLVFHKIDTNSIEQAKPHIVDRSRSEVAESNSLIGITGSIHHAVHFLWLCGINRINLIGVNPESGNYFDGCEFDSIPSKLNVYDRIYKDTVSLCEVLGIDLIKFG